VGNADADAFTTAGCHVSFPVPGPGEYGTMIISRVHAEPGDFTAALGYLPGGAASVTLPAPAGNIQVIGARADYEAALRPRCGTARCC
jgi:hypothetical protein